MSGSRRRRWLFVAFVMGLTALLIPVAKRLLGRHRLRFNYAVGTLSPAAYAALTNGPQWAASTIVVAPGISLNGIVRRPTDAAAPWILFYSGNDATPLATAQKFLERVRDGRDWGVATWAYRGFDSSSGIPERDALVSDATQVFDGLLAKEHLDPARVHVVAFSLGGYFASHVVGGAAKAQRKPASLSLLASVEDIEMVLPSWTTTLLGGDVYEIEPLMGAVPPPVLVVQGTEDEAIGVGQGRAIAALLGPRAHYVELDGVGHNALLETEPAIVAVREMIVASHPR